MNGASDPVFVLSLAVGVTVATSEAGHGSVLNVPLSSARAPFWKRATTRKRYVVAGSSPVTVVRSVIASRANVVGDQMP
jgi:hypothetical protein